MLSEKEIKKIINKIPKIAMKSPYEPLYLEGIRRALNCVLGKCPDPTILNKESDMICDRCGTDLVKNVIDSNVKICLNCRNYIT